MATTNGKNGYVTGGGLELGTADYSKRSEALLDVAEILAHAFGGENSQIQMEDILVAAEAIKRRQELKDAYFKNLGK